MSNLTTTEIVNMFCNMTGVCMNEAQRDALMKLIEGIYESGVKARESEEQELDPSPVPEEEKI